MNIERVSVTDLIQRRRPGYSLEQPTAEATVDDFVSWYLRELQCLTSSKNPKP